MVEVQASALPRGICILLIALMAPAILVLSRLEPIRALGDKYASISGISSRRLAISPFKPAYNHKLEIMVNPEHRRLHYETELVLRSVELAPEQRQFVEHLWKTELPLPEQVQKELPLLQAGHKHEVAGRNFARLADKLASGYGLVKVVAFGGSVTLGSETWSYAGHFVKWLRAAFPSSRFELTNLARGASAATYAALCLVQDLPDDADLVVLEYSVNGWGGECQCFTASQTAGYETLIRKVIRKTPQAALLGFAAFTWLDKDKQPSKYYETGEDQQAAVARRYGIPMMSVRDALYDAMFDDTRPYGIDRTKILRDGIHPGVQGYSVYASFLAWAIRHHITRALLHNRVFGTETSQPPGQMPPPLNPETAQEDWPTFCAHDTGINSIVQESKGWSFVDEGNSNCASCHKYGLRATVVNSTLVLRVNSSVLTGANDTTKVMLAVTYLRSYSLEMGKARLECISGCTCAPSTIDARNNRNTSELHTQRMEIGAASNCMVRLTILPETSTGGHKFRLASLAVHKADKVLNFSYIATAE